MKCIRFLYSISHTAWSIASKFYTHAHWHVLRHCCKFRRKVCNGMRDMRDFVFLILFGFVVVVAQGIKTKWRFQKVGFVLIVQSRFHHCRKYKFLYVTPKTYQVFYIKQISPMSHIFGHRDNISTWEGKQEWFSYHDNKSWRPKASSHSIGKIHAW